MILMQRTQQEVATRGNLQQTSHAISDAAAFDQFVGRQIVYFISENMKDTLVADILRNEGISNGIIYMKTNFAADRLAEYLNRSGITAESVHDNKSRRTGDKSFANFRDSFTRILVTTESAASKMTATGVAVIINYDLSVSAETYTRRLKQHRMVAGRSIKAMSFCNESEKSSLKNINRVLMNELEVVEHHLDQSRP
ncbi:MAG TPA: DEAD/DEAH box helicase [Chryseosolibacter sp.]|nr:DEAD/DEAH box helicase [Chryseosolibacter sp.]